MGVGHAQDDGNGGGPEDGLDVGCGVAAVVLAAEGAGVDALGHITLVGDAQGVVVEDTRGQ